MLVSLLEHVLEQMEDFLAGWTQNMSDAGYLEHTTAKRDDCIMSIRHLMQPIIAYLAAGGRPDFAHIMKHERNMANGLIHMAANHKSRGITAEMFFGCFKTMLHSVDSIILSADVSSDEKLRMYMDYRRIIDGIESITIASWDADGTDERLQMLENTARALTLAKNKYENIFQATSDIVFVTDSGGKILEMNQAAVAKFGAGIIGDAVFRYIGIDPVDDDELFRLYPMQQQHELTLPDKNTVVSISAVPLKKVSLASAGCVLVLNDITCMVSKRTQLELLVDERTKALARSENIFRSIFSSAGDGIILTDDCLNIIQSNGKAGEMFGYNGMTGINCSKIFHPDGIRSISKGLLSPEICTTETQCKTSDGQWFTASITLNRFMLENEMYIHFIVRNITDQKLMEQRILQEKAAAEEMNVTLRNVMKTIDRDKEETETAIAQKITTQILPSLKKTVTEDSAEIRQMYGNILKDLLMGLVSPEAMNGSSLVKLSKTEIEICRYIQQGYSTKEIGNIMNVSHETVQTHRKNIRKKLGLSGKDTNLFSFLNNS